MEAEASLLFYVPPLVTDKTRNANINDKNITFFSLSTRHGPNVTTGSATV